jgi:hypothetical protein
MSCSAAASGASCAYTSPLGISDAVANPTATSVVIGRNTDVALIAIERLGSSGRDTCRLGGPGGDTLDRVARLLDLGQDSARVFEQALSFGSQQNAARRAIEQRSA